MLDGDIHNMALKSKIKHVHSSFRPITNDIYFDYPLTLYLPLPFVSTVAEMCLWGGLILKGSGTLHPVFKLKRTYHHQDETNTMNSQPKAAKCYSIQAHPLLNFPLRLSTGFCLLRTFYKIHATPSHQVFLFRSNRKTHSFTTTTSSADHSLIWPSTTSQEKNRTRMPET